MANQIAIKVHTQPGDEVIVEAWSHPGHVEARDAGLISGVLLRTIETERGIYAPSRFAPSSVRAGCTRAVPASCGSRIRTTWAGERCGRSLARIPGIEIDPARVKTNILFLDVKDPRWDRERFVKALGEEGADVAALPQGIRPATHLAIDDEDIDRAITAVHSVQDRG